jgi:hypothetical protein
VKEGNEDLMVVDVPKSKCAQTLRLTFACINVPTLSFFLLMKKEGAVIRHSNALMQTAVLTDENKVTRVLYCIDKIQPRTINSRTGGPMDYKEDMDIVEIDENCVG